MQHVGIRVGRLIDPNLYIIALSSGESDDRQVICSAPYLIRNEKFSMFLSATPVPRATARSGSSAI